jgi:hypothetical protein
MSLYISGREVTCQSMMRSGTNFVWQSPTLSPHRGMRSRESSCKSNYSVLNSAHELPSYPLSYSLVVIPLSISRWLKFSHKNVPSAALFFGEIMYSLSGAINVLLFLIVRPHLLLFTPPDELVEPIVEHANPTTSSVLLPGVHIHSPKPTGAELTNDV